MSIGAELRLVIGIFVSILNVLEVVMGASTGMEDVVEQPGPVISQGLIETRNFVSWSLALFMVAAGCTASRDAPLDNGLMGPDVPVAGAAGTVAPTGGVSGAGMGGMGGVAGGGTSGGGDAGTGGTGGGAAGTGGTGGGTAGTGGTGGGAAGTGGTGGGTAGTGGAARKGHEGAVVDPVGNANRAPGFIDLSAPMGEPLPVAGDNVTPAPPSGWTWHNIDGAYCRDGSGTGLYVRRGTGDGLLVYFEGGGACSNNHYCAFNPANVNTVLAGDGQVVLGSALGTGPGRQQPGVYTDASHAGAPAGVFDTNNNANPFKDWSQVYIPYCTGDVHFGTNESGMVPNLPSAQKFVGYHNTRKMIGRVVPTFKDSVSKVVLAGSSAGGFAAALNFSMVQDSFGDVPVMVLDDSGPPFENDFMPVCMQKKWRAAWGLTDAMPPDCEECRDPAGGNMVRLADFLLRKHPTARIAMVSSMQDEVIRLFYSVGLVDCQNYDTADPVATVLLQGDPSIFMPAAQYEGGLMELRNRYTSTGRFASYYMGGANISNHQHLFRPRFYETAAGGKSVAQFATEFINGTVQNVGP